LATHLGMRSLVAHCRLEPDKVYQRMGRREETREHLATATTMYREMDMRFWLDQASLAPRAPVMGESLSVGSGAMFIHHLYYAHPRDSRRGPMTASALRHKHVQLDQRKLDRARRALGARTETETLHRALDLVVTEADIDRVLRAGRRKGKIRRVF